ncbi:MAG: galactokinase [Leptonema sp. (in: Bacteria)]|nr:galactokinase [Leptonema sp. (in: bacteria)]
MLSQLDTANLKAKFISEFGATPDYQFFAPGRINLIGEHIDYVGGSVLPAAIDRGIAAFVSKRTDQKIRLRSMQATKGIDFDIKHLSGSRLYQESKETSWVNYAIGMFQSYYSESNFQAGFDIYYSSNLPVASGLSSSAALTVLTGYIISIIEKSYQNKSHDYHQNNFQKIDLTKSERISLAKTAQQVENYFIGVQCGIMDQFAVSLGKEGQFIHLNTENLTYDYVPITKETDFNLVVINSNRARKLSESKYNERLLECQKALSILQKTDPTIKHLVDAPIELLSVLTNEPALLKRARHVITENQRVKAVVQYLKKGNIISVGQLLNESHLSLKNDYQVSSSELDVLQLSCLEFEACVGARMTGAGFGGCLIALLIKPHFQQFADQVSSKYFKQTKLQADIFSVTIVNGVQQL